VCLSACTAISLKCAVKCVRASVLNGGTHCAWVLHARDKERPKCLSVDGKVNVCGMGDIEVARRLSGGCVAPPAAGMHLDRHLLLACTWPHRRVEGGFPL
jgi:hypothetical protein